jgi:hypothetical protein
MKNTAAVEYENYRTGLTEMFDQNPTFRAAMVEVVIQEIQTVSKNFALVNELHKLFPFQLAPVADPPNRRAPAKRTASPQEHGWTMENYCREMADDERAAKRRPSKPKRRTFDDDGQPDEPVLLSRFF